jgi:hypothetical protein
MGAHAPITTVKVSVVPYWSPLDLRRFKSLARFRFG